MELKRAVIFHHQNVGTIPAAAKTATIFQDTNVAIPVYAKKTAVIFQHHNVGVEEASEADMRRAAIFNDQNVTS